METHPGGKLSDQPRWVGSRDRVRASGTAAVSDVMQVARWV